MLIVLHQLHILFYVFRIAICRNVSWATCHRTVPESWVWPIDGSCLEINSGNLYHKAAQLMFVHQQHEGVKYSSVECTSWCLLLTHFFSFFSTIWITLALFKAVAHVSTLWFISIFSSAVTICQHGWRKEGPFHKTTAEHQTQTRTTRLHSKIIMQMIFLSDFPDS